MNINKNNKLKNIREYAVILFFQIFLHKLENSNKQINDTIDNKNNQVKL